MISIVSVILVSLHAYFIFLKSALHPVSSILHPRCFHSDSIRLVKNNGKGLDYKVNREEGAF